MLCLSALETGFYGSVGDAQGTNSLFFCLLLDLDIRMGRAEQGSHPCGFPAALDTAKRAERKVQGKTFPEPRDRPSLCTDVLETLRVAVFCPGVKSTNHKASSLLAL